MGKFFIRNLQRRRSASSLVAILSDQQERTQVVKTTCSLFKKPADMHVEKAVEMPPAVPHVDTAEEIKTRTAGIALPPKDVPKEPPIEAIRTAGIAVPPKDVPKEPPIEAIRTAGIAVPPKDVPKEPPIEAIRTAGIAVPPKDPPIEIKTAGIAPLPKVEPKEPPVIRPMGIIAMPPDKLLSNPFKPQPFVTPPKWGWWKNPWRFFTPPKNWVTTKNV